MRVRAAVVLVSAVIALGVTPLANATTPQTLPSRGERNFTVTGGTVEFVMNSQFLDTLAAAGATLAAIPPARLENNPLATQTVVVFPVRRVRGNHVILGGTIESVSVALKGGLIATGNGRTQEMTQPKFMLGQAPGNSVLQMFLSSRGTYYPIARYVASPTFPQGPDGRRLTMELGQANLDQEWVFRGLSQWPDQPGDGVAPTFTYRNAPMFDSTTLALTVKPRPS